MKAITTVVYAVNMSDGDRVDELLVQWRAELPDVLGPTSELVKRLMLLAAEMTTATQAALPAFGLTPADHDVLATLRRSGEPYRMKPNELSRSVLLSSGGISNVVNRLAARGLVRREADQDDGRSTLIQLTDEGVALAEKAVRSTSAAHAALLADVPPEVVEAATIALRAVSATVDGLRPRRR